MNDPIEDLEKKLAQLKSLIELTSKKTYSTTETEKICQVVECELVRSKRRYFLQKDDVKVFEGTLKEIVDFCYKLVL